MPPSAIPFFARAAVCLCLLAGVSFAHADVFDEGDHVMVEVGPYVYHRLDNTGHNQWPHLIGVEYETASNWLAGAAYFENSYYQDAALLYGSKRWFIPPVSENLYVKVAGVRWYTATRSRTKTSCRSTTMVTASQSCL